MFLMSFWSFQRSNVSLWRLKGCNVTLHQTLRMVPSPEIKPGLSTRSEGRADWLDFFSNLQIWQLVTLQPFNQQRPKVPLWKDFDQVVNWFLLKRFPAFSFSKPYIFIFGYCKSPCNSIVGFVCLQASGICIYTKQIGWERLQKI